MVAPQPALKELACKYGIMHTHILQLRASLLFSVVTLRAITIIFTSVLQ